MPNAQDTASSPAGTAALKGISSMATRLLLADLSAAYTAQTGQLLSIESVGGVDAAKRVQAAEAFDVVLLASDAIDKLMAAGHLVPGSRVDFVRSDVAVAVQAGAKVPDISTEAALRQAVLDAATVSYSTGPSGVALVQLFERWGIAQALAPKLVQAPPGVPVGSLVAQGQVALGFQQRSELIHVPGIQIVGALPPAVQIITTFSGAVGALSQQPERVRAWLAYLRSAPTAEAKQRQGMAPA